MRSLLSIFVLMTSNLAVADHPLDALFTSTRGGIAPGCSIAGSRDGEQVLQRSYGYSNLDYGIHATADSRYHVASVSKQFTAAAVEQLAREGRLDLDAHPSKYLPEVSHLHSDITIRQLIHHTSGVRDQWELLGLAGWRYSQDLITNEDVMSLLSIQKDLNFQPNSEHLYSNSGYTLLAILVERVSGKSFRAFTGETIFEPLDMTSTFFRDNFAEVVPNQATGYVLTNSETYEVSETNFDTVGATSLLSTPTDLIKWGELFYKGDDRVQGLLSKGVLADGEVINYAFGIDIETIDGKTHVSHGGSDAGFRSFLLTVLEDKVSVAVTCNTPLNTGELANKIYQWIVKGSFEETGTAPSERAEIAFLSEMNGMFFNEKNGLMWELEDGRAYVLGFESPIVVKSSTLLSIPELGIHARFNEAFSELTVESPTSGKNVYKRFLPVESDQKRYVGEYYSEELNTIFSITRHNDQLTLSYPKNPNISLVSPQPGMLLGSVGRLLFDENSDGVITGFQLGTLRIRGLKFKKLTL